MGRISAAEDLAKLEEEQMLASCWASLASRSAAGGREPPLSNTSQQVGEIWVCRREKGLCITLRILESWSPASAHASSKEGTPQHGSAAGQAEGVGGGLRPP